MQTMTIIVPCYNEEEALPYFYEEISKIRQQLTEISLKLLFINDGSTDNTLAILKKLASSDNSVYYISFSRNFGKEAAIYAGLKNSTSDYTAIMDADLQDPPSLLPEMAKILESGEYDSVATRRVSRDGEPPIRSFCARQFYKLINKISDSDIVDGARDYRLMKREMVDAIVKMGENNRFSKGIFGWIGYRTYWYPYENVERAAGETKWNFFQLLKYSIDGIVSFSHVPLSIASWCGLLFTGLSFLAILFIVIRRLVFGDPVQGWASTCCVIIFIGGIQLFSMGIIGQYIAKIFAETKHRPHYIISEASDEVEKIN